ncbi:MAG: hypothetical protein WCI36_03845 [bacterium]
MKIKKSLPIFLAIAILSGATFKFAKAWTEPTTAPPSSNIGAPITTGSQGQTKSGAIGISAWDSQLWQGNGTTKRSIGGAYGWDPNQLYINGWGEWTNGVTIGGGGGNSDLSVTGGVFSNARSRFSGGQYGPANGITIGDDQYQIYSIGGNIYMNSTIGNTVLQPNGGGVNVGLGGTSDLTVTGRIYANDWFRPRNNSGLYFQDHGMGLNMVDNTWIRIYSDWGTPGNLYAPGELQATTVKANSNLCIGGDCRNAWPSFSGLQLNTWQGSHYSGSDGAEYATIFYDSNDGSYYVNPNGGSQFNAVYANNWIRPQGDTGIYFQDHGGGLNMTDNTWVRTYGVGNFYAYGESQATTVRANSNLVTPKISFTDGTVQTSAAVGSAGVNCNWSGSNMLPGQIPGESGSGGGGSSHLTAGCGYGLPASSTTCGDICVPQPKVMEIYCSGGKITDIVAHDWYVLMGSC